MKTIVAGILLAGALLQAGCRPRATSDSVPSPVAGPPAWPRQHFQPTGAKALVWYQVYGRFSDTIEISRSKYRCNGIPPGIDVSNHTRPGEEQVVTALLKEPLLAARLKRDLPEIARTIDTVSDCTIIRGEIPDSANLDYLRDVVGLVTWFLDNGGVAVLDPQTLTWYDREQWRAKLFEPNNSVPLNHVIILYSGENGITNNNPSWFHTRGMRKFARPDLGIRGVPVQHRDAAIELLNRLVEMQAFGQVVPEGQPIKMQSLPFELTCHHLGSLDDPEFNNTHIEIRWPQ